MTSGSSLLRAGSSSLQSISYAWAAIAGAVCLLVVNIGLEPSMAAPRNWASVVAVATPFMMASMAQAPALVIGHGGLDLSVGPLAGLVTVVIAKFAVPGGLSGPFPLVGIAVGLGAASGVIVGVLVAYGRIPPIIVTLGGFLFYTGLAIDLMPTPGGTVPPWLTQLAHNVGPLPGMWVLFLGVIVVWLCLQRTAYRRNWLAVGGEARAAYTAGVKVGAVKVGAYLASGVLSAVTGLSFLAVLGSADATATEPYTLISFAGAALGGVTLLGGRGGLLGAACGGAILFLVQNLLGLAQVSVFDIQIVYGVILILALALGSVVESRRRSKGGRVGLGRVARAIMGAEAAVQAGGEASLTARGLAGRYGPGRGER